MSKVGEIPLLWLPREGEGDRPRHSQFGEYGPPGLAGDCRMGAKDMLASLGTGGSPSLPGAGSVLEGAAATGAVALAGVGAGGVGPPVAWGVAACWCAREMRGPSWCMKPRRSCDREC